MKLRRCQVTIRCDGETMREYDTSEEGNEVYCWIPSRPGKEFTIEYSRNLNYGPKDAELTVDVFFDGKFSDGWIAPDPEPRARKVSGEIRGSRRGNKLHHFVFSEPEIIEGETPSSVNPKYVGDIWVMLGFVAKSECAGLEAKPAIMDYGPTRVNESDKKPGAHCAVLKKSSEECAEPVFFCTPADKDRLFFTFRCRSEESLRAEGKMRKRRRQRGDPEPVEDPGVPPPPKLELMETISERPRKIAKKSGSFTFTVDSKSEGSSGSKVKVEELKAKVEEIEAQQKELEDAMIKLREKKCKLEDEIATITIPRTGNEMNPPKRKMKAKGGSTRLPMTPEVIDTTD